MLPLTYLRSVSNGIQLLAAAALPIFQVVVPSYSERWFDLKGRTTATMIMGLGMCFSRPPPLVPLARRWKISDYMRSEPRRECTRAADPSPYQHNTTISTFAYRSMLSFPLIAEQILVMAIIFTAAAPIVFFVGEAPPTPPSMSDCGLVAWLVAHHVTRSIRRYPQAPFAIFSHACDARKGAA